MSEWKEYKLGKVCSRLRSGKNLKSNLIFPEGKYPVWGGNGVRGYTNECNFKGQCCVIGRQGAYCGNVHYYDGEAYMTEHAIVVVGNELADTYYLACALSLMHLENLSAQSAQPGISVQTLSTQTITLPPIEEQKRIAGVLSSLDDKIDLLNRENATLDALAETLFRHYFIENPNPEWKEGKLGDILSVKGGTTPSTTDPRFWNGNIAWTSPRDITTLNGMYLFKTERTITEEGLAKISSGLLPAGTLLMSSRAPVGVLAFAEIPLAINQGYIAIIDDKGYPKEFIYLWLTANMENIHNYSNGSTFMEISKFAFKSLDILIPPKPEVAVFVKIIKPYFEKIHNNEKQILSLVKMRDGLLPKLMSNEITI